MSYFGFIYQQLNQDPAYREHLHDLYARHTGYCYVKKLIMLFEKIVLEKQKTHFNPAKSLHFCMEAILPLDDKQRFLACKFLLNNLFQQKI